MRLLATLALALLAAAAQAAPPDSVALPPPTGPHAVGTATWHWVDASRPDEVTPRPDDVREIMAQLWYPARPDSGAVPAPYAPLYPSLASVQAWSVARAPVAPEAGTLPVVVVAPGRGVARHFYTALAEDLASHGYAVLAVDSPHSGRVTYPDGRTVRPAPRYRIPFEVLTGPYEAVDAFFEEAAALGSADLAFALDRLAALVADDPAGLLTGRLELRRLAMFGHSLGGRIGGAAVASDPRFVAYASMEGVPPRTPRQGGLDAAVLMLYSSSLPEMAMPNIREIVPGRRADVHLARLDGYGHNSMTDLALLDPGAYSYDVEPRAALDTSREVVRGFFDAYLRPGTAPFPHAAGWPAVAIETHPAPE
ncbi:alpha/beta hydrolase family protein [Rubrivirga sp. IMCC43871]|uniref:alpha/beta hydrolase family protein n=1 Tax=Rubrivirga sp. IMCC43871 TaxID=3391575 RepID=UPI00398FED17